MLFFLHKSFPTNSSHSLLWPTDEGIIRFVGLYHCSQKNINPPFLLWDHLPSHFFLHKGDMKALFY